MRFTDPDGMGVNDVIYSGESKDKAFNQLKANAKNLDLQMDSNGKITGTVKEGSNATDAEKLLLDATTDHSILVEVNTTSSNTFVNSKGQNQLITGGQYDGNSSSTSGLGIDSSIEGNANTIMIANQTYNPDQGVLIDEAAGLAEGTTAIHETLEPYVGAKIAQTTGVNGSDYSVFKQAHSFVNGMKQSDTSKFVPSLSTAKNPDGTYTVKVSALNPVKGSGEIFTINNYRK